MASTPRYEQEETNAAAAEAAGIGGVTGEEELDPAQLPVTEAGGGVAEGFEEMAAKRDPNRKMRGETNAFRVMIKQRARRRAVR